MTLFFFIATLLLALSAAAGLIRARRLRFMVVPWFIFSWPGSELPIWLLALQLLLIVSNVIFSDTSSLFSQLSMVLALWNCVALIRLHKINVNSGQQALADFTSKTGLEVPLPDASLAWQKPFNFRRADVKKISNINYGDNERHKLDIYYGSKPKRENRPVLLQIHGGAWVIGDKKEQALPLMYTMASRDWICVACNYRLGPADRFPAMIEDVETCLGWIRENIHSYGGDPDHVYCTGGSAGGHLTALLALRNQNIKAAVPFYGIYDFLDRNNIRREMNMESFLESKVMPGSVAEYPDIWETASPIALIANEDSEDKKLQVPFLIIHGTHDSLAFDEEAQMFAEQLNQCGDTVYLPVNGAQHAFDMIWSARSSAVVELVYCYLENNYKTAVTTK